MLELGQLEQLLAVAEHGTLSAAAEAIHLSQPSMSRSMKKLEDDLQVILFERRKNKITLNENGKLAVECARKVLDQLRQMENQVRAFDRSHRTISVGGCAPVPLLDVVQRLTTFFGSMTISSELLEEPQKLVEGLHDGTYQIVILPEPLTQPQYYCAEWGKEQLYFSLPPAHPLSNAPGLHFRDLDGESILLFAQIGFWLKIGKQKMPSTHFLMQQEWYDFAALMRASALPFFASDILLRRGEAPENRVVIPILDEEARATYYCACLSSQFGRFENFFRNLLQTSREP